jgi:aminoglycoside/choline kinase family phosphotransferase
MTPQGRDEPELDDVVRRAVHAALGAEMVRSQAIDDGLGLRRFVRVFLAPTSDGPDTLIARIDAAEDPAGRPAGIPPEPPLEPIRSLLELHGLPVPARYGGDLDSGVMLLEDLGDVSLADAVRDANATERTSLYRQACDLVTRLQRVAPEPGVEAFERRLDANVFAYKADLFLDFSVAARGRDATAAEAAAVRGAFAQIAERVAHAPARLAHRDFQSSNVRVLDRPGGSLALIDLQGALMTAPEYDLVCLLRDSYVELSDAECADWSRAARENLPDPPEPDVFEQRFDLLTLTRKAKDHARFVYAARVRNDSRYLPFLPATLRFLRAAAERAAGREPAFAALAELVHTLPESPCAP